MPVENRFRGHTVLASAKVGSVPNNTIEALSSAPLGTPTISNDGESSHDPRQFVTTITFNRNTDTATEVIARRSVIGWHLEDTAGGLFTSATVVTNDNTSGNSGIGLVILDSTANFFSGKVICSSTGQATIAIGTSTGDGSTARMFLTLPNGQVVAGSTLDFSS